MHIYVRSVRSDSLEERGEFDQGKASDLTEDLGAAPLWNTTRFSGCSAATPPQDSIRTYKWIEADDPLLLLDAEATFKDIGGHQGEANAAEASYKRATCERQLALLCAKRGRALTRPSSSISAARLASTVKRAFSIKLSARCFDRRDHVVSLNSVASDAKKLRAPDSPSRFDHLRTF